MIRVARVAMAGTCLLSLAACAGATASEAGTTSPTTTAQTTSTTAAPSTTSEPTTTLSPQAQDEADIRALHDRFFQMIVLTGNPPDPDHTEIAATTTGIQRQRWEDFVETMRQLGERSEANVQGSILAIQVLDGDHAAIRDCTLAVSSRIAADGAVVGRDDGPASVTELRLLRAADGWRVEDWYTGGAEPCDS